ncbi:MAG: Cof-type HAD-IIB family hydrolase [Eubacterium sp.]|nr:Cof-type HAD-IIB family hydrolase [Eubacterium sp.]
MEKKKLLLTDLDGTLLTSDKRISPATRSALDRFTEAGNIFAISTGRAAESALNVQQSMGLDYPGSFVVSYNGASIQRTDIGPDGKRTYASVFRTGVGLDLVPEVFAMADACSVHCHTYNDNYILSRAWDKEMDFYRRHIKTPVIIDEHIMNQIQEAPCKMIAIELEDRSKIERLREELHAKFSDRLTTIFSNPWYLEIFPADAGKGNALRKLAGLLNIPIENTMAAGDAENDISMIQAAGLGIAMCNGDEKVKAAADVITEKDNDHDGLEPYLQDDGAALHN